MRSVSGRLRLPGLMPMRAVRSAASSRLWCPIMRDRVNAAQEQAA